MRRTAAFANPSRVRRGFSRLAQPARRGLGVAPLLLFQFRHHAIGPHCGTQLNRHLQMAAGFAPEPGGHCDFRQLQARIARGSVQFTQPFETARTIKRALFRSDGAIGLRESEMR